MQTTLLIYFFLLCQTLLFFGSKLLQFIHMVYEDMSLKSYVFSVSVFSEIHGSRRPFEKCRCVELQNNK
jgi:hypothetical protein